MAISKKSKIVASDMSSLINGLSISGNTITYTKVDGTTGTLTTQEISIIPDYTAGVTITINNSNQEIPFSGILVTTYMAQWSVDRYLYINDIPIYHCGYDATVSFIIPIPVSKGDKIRGVHWTENATLYPLKGI